jgi:endonuclease YncB( thermonuclease family)
LVLFVGKKIRFIGVDGQEDKSPAQGTCLYSFGLRGRVALENAVRCGLGALMIPASTVKSDRSALKLEEACSARP